MKKIEIRIYVLFVILILSLYSISYSQWFFDAETGMAFSGYNNVRIPRETGTEFSLSQDLKTDPNFFFRMRFGYQIKSKHTLSVLVAPLRLKASGRIDKTIGFYEEDFPADVSLNAVYQFNSYRLTYRYDFIRKKNLRLGFGFTAKIRDAVIRVEGDNKQSEKANIGFVPLINFRLEWLLSKKWSLLLEGDALAAPQGRAEDVLLALQLHLNDAVTLKAGYRILEGGADVEEVYNFALIHFITAGATYRF
ncbi:MAG: hypothetical protein ACOC5F_00980 [Candidatus Aminicenantaceae bacterium]